MTLDSESQESFIQNRARMQQIYDFKGLRFGEKMWPTDIDGFLDFDDRLFVFIEGKFLYTKLKWGQETAITRLCDACKFTPHRYWFAIIADHHHPAYEDIDAANMTVRSIRQNRQWQEPMQRGLSVRAAIDRMVEVVEKRQGCELVKKPTTAQGIGTAY